MEKKIIEAESKLTKDQLDFLRIHLDVFKKGYYLRTHTKLEIIDQIVNVIEKGDFVYEDLFNMYIDEIFTSQGFGNMEEEDIFFEENMDMFRCINYFPDHKDVKEGSWIKIRTENGFEIHYAKKSNRKRRFYEEAVKISEHLILFNNRQINDLKDESKKVDEICSPSKEKKKQLLKSKLQELNIRSMIALKPYEVRINRTKSKVEYYLPYQYELVNDIEEFSNAYMDDMVGVNIKSLYTSQNRDAVFYLTSRGISKKVAEMMATLKQTYFIIDMNKAMVEFNKQWKHAVKLKIAKIA